ncbi:MAG: HgcAB-like fusion protein [Candidatus Thorarchaeota archaeon]
MTSFDIFYNIFVFFYAYMFRMFPLPHKTGIIKINHPDKDSPVFVTGNYALTVIKVKKALKNLNCYLLVANSKGINVWCGATGGYFTTHGVLSILKTSGIEDMINHRKVILPQLAATGIEKKEIERKTSWKIIWGPVYAKDIPDFIENEWVKTNNMRQVTFTFIQRVEIAVIWALPFSLIGSLIVGFIWPNMLLPLNALIWGSASLIYILFPYYLKQIPKGFHFSKYTILFDFNLLTLLIWVLIELVLLFLALFVSSFAWQDFLKWSITLFIVLLFISMDLKGSTPLVKSGLHEEVSFKINIDLNKCKGIGICKEVCPRDCFEVDKKNHTVKIVRVNQCVQCGACIVQCPLDAIVFRNSKGEIINPEIIRKYKLNLLGKRIEDSGLTKIT